jgi:predicted hydrocarbon binding protein
MQDLPFDIEPFKAQEMVIRQTVAQIKKDFNMFGMDVEFPLDLRMVYDDLVKHVNDNIETLLYRNLQKLSSLLYQVDINESEILKAWEEHPEYTKSQVITELLIYRELKKVLFRNYYKEYKLKDSGE